MNATRRHIAKTGRWLWTMTGALALVAMGACGGKSSSTSNNNNDQEPFCGNGVMDATEMCDGSDLAGATCVSLGLGTGDLACDEDCTFDVSGCSDQADCGNGVREYPETCDGTDLGEATCGSLGYPGGVLGCAEDCTHDISGCDTCGNDIIDGDEQCDGPDLGGASCESLELGEGDLACTGACTFDTSGCAIQTQCGDGVKDPGEECDLNDLGEEDCVSQGFAGGELACTDACTLDTSGCSNCPANDAVAPEASGHEPAPETQGAPPSTLISVDLFDACGFNLDSIAMRISVTPRMGPGTVFSVTPVVSGTGTNITAAYQHSSDFPRGSIVSVLLTAADPSGNTLTEDWRFSVVDELILSSSGAFGTTLVNAINEAFPNINYSTGSSYDVGGESGSEVRMIIRFAPEVPEGPIFAARLDLGICWASPPVTPVVTHIDCHRLNVDSVANQATWNRRISTGGPSGTWTEPGASAVPADREGTPAATMDPSGAPANSYVSADVLPLVLNWQAGEGYHGILCSLRETFTVPICSTGFTSTAPPRIVLRYGPALP